jgi:hypothetical protein
MKHRLHHNGWQEGFIMANDTGMASDSEAQAPLEPVMGASEEAAMETATDPSVMEAEEPEVAFSWQASEYVHHHKSMGWYAALAVIVAVLISLAVWMELWLEIGVFLAMAGAVVVYARKPPRTMLYELTPEGVRIEGVLRPFSEFRSFGVIPDEEWHSIDLEPTQRLRPRTVLLFDTPDLDQITAHLERHLPREDRELDIIERVTRLVRF